MIWYQASCTLLVNAWPQDMRSTRPDASVMAQEMERCRSDAAAADAAAAAAAAVATQAQQQAAAQATTTVLGHPE